MSHNHGRSAVPGPVVARLVAATAARLADRHPGIDDTIVHAVVYQAAAELAGTVSDSKRLRQLLVRRAHARLMALTDAPVPIASARPGPGT